VKTIVFLCFFRTYYWLSGSYKPP